MKFLHLLAAVQLALLPAAPLFAASPAAARSETFEVGESPEWLATGIRLRAGDRLSLRTEGLAAAGRPDPEGRPDSESDDLRSRVANDGQLLVRIEIGRNHNYTVPGEAEWSGEAAADGQLMLGVNMPTGRAPRAQPVFAVTVDHVPQVSSGTENVAGSKAGDIAGAQAAGPKAVKAGARGQGLSMAMLAVLVLGAVAAMLALGFWAFRRQGAR